MTVIQSTHMDAQQQLPSYIERPSNPSSIFAIWAITSVPPGSEKWTWHEQTMQVLGLTGLVHLPENNADMLAFIQNLMNVLPHQSRTEERPLVSDEVVDEARAWVKRPVAKRSALSINIPLQGVFIRIEIACFSSGGAIAVVMQFDGSIAIFPIREK